MEKNVAGEVVCFGEILWDVLPGGAKAGGAPLNVAIHLKKQGHSPLVISKVGDDSEGKELVRFIKNAGLNDTFIATDTELPTSKVLVRLDANKNASYEICEPVAWDNIISDKQKENLCANARIIIFGSLASRNAVTRRTLTQLLKNSEAKRIFDVNLRPPFDDPGIVESLLKLADFVKMNDEELIKIASWHGESGKIKNLIVWFSKYYNCPEICVTRGAKGAFLLINDSVYEHRGFKIDAEDTVGAGDSFLAALIAQLEKKQSPQKSLEYACATGAYVASKPGATPDYSEKDIEKIIQSSDS